MVLKLANKYQIIWHCRDFKNIFIDDFQHQPFLYRAKENSKLKRRDNSTSIHYYLIYLDPEGHFVKLYSTRKFDLSWSMEMYHFKE